MVNSPAAELDRSHVWTQSTMRPPSGPVPPLRRRPRARGEQKTQETGGDWRTPRMAENRGSEAGGPRWASEQDKEPQRLLTIAGAAGTFSRVSENNWLVGGPVRGRRTGARGGPGEPVRRRPDGRLCQPGRARAHRSATGLGPLLQPVPRRPVAQGRDLRARSAGGPEVRLDCDGDAVLYRVEQTGPACHTGDRTCFSTVLIGDQRGAGRRGRTPAATC